MTEPVIVVGAGPSGMAAALALRTAGHEVVVLERYPTIKPAGATLALWPPPIKVLECVGVDTTNLGAPVSTTVRSQSGRLRATVTIPPEVKERYGGGFVGLLRPDLYRRMADALDGVLRPGHAVTGFEDRGDHVSVTLSDGTTRDTPLLVGADGIDSAVRKGLWGDSPKREHHLHAFGGYTFESVAGVPHGIGVTAHGRTVQASYTSMLSGDRKGIQWWMVEACDPHGPGPDDLYAHALEKAKSFQTDILRIVEASPPETTWRWVLRDRKPLKQWSRGRITLAGDAAHATSPYAAYGAGMSIVDGYFLAKLLAGVDLADTAAVGRALAEYDRIRIPHTTGQVQQAWFLGQLFHRMPRPVQWLRDLVFDHTSVLQYMVGTKSPAEIFAQLEEMGDGIRPPRQDADDPGRTNLDNAVKE